MFSDLIRPYQGEDESSFAKRKAYFLRLVATRLEFHNEDINTFKRVNVIPLDASEIEEIDGFWSHYLPCNLRERLIDKDYYGFYKKVKKDNELLVHYLPDMFYQAFIDEYFTNPQHSRPFDDKNQYDLYFHDVYRPKTIFRKLRNQYLDSDYNFISQEQAIKLAKNNGEVILKIAKFSCGGKGILFWNGENKNDEELLKFLNQSDRVICQNVIKQHAELNRLNPSSVNTIRVMTLMFKDKVHVLSGVLRMGVNGSRVDNASSGGIICGIMPDGRLKNVAYNPSGNQFFKHPQGTAFDSVSIPNYSQCIDLAVTLAKRLSSVTRQISWDFAIDESGQPILIEFNVTWGQLDFHQLCNGPIFGDLTHEVLDEVFQNSYTLKSILKSLK